MNSVKQYLIPKSTKEIEKDLKKINPFEFVYFAKYNKQYKQHAKGIRVGLQKRIILFLVTNKYVFILPMVCAIIFDIILIFKLYNKHWCFIVLFLLTSIIWVLYILIVFLYSNYIRKIGEKYFEEINHFLV